MQASVTLSIKETRVHKDVIVLVDEHNYVWVYGPNAKMRLGVAANESMISPVRTSIQFKRGETIRQIYSTPDQLFIHTSRERLFISKVIKPSIVGDHDGITDEQGVYVGVQDRDLPEFVPSEDPLGADVPSEFETLHQWLQDSQWKQKNLISVQFASTPGFEMLTNVYKISSAGPTILFTKNGMSCLFNWKLVVHRANQSDMGLALTPLLHRGSLIYYELQLPFEPSFIDYYQNFLYARVNQTHHVFSAPYPGSDAPIVWRYFYRHNFSVRQLDLSESETDPMFVMWNEGKPYAYNQFTRSFTLLNKPGVQTEILNKGAADSVQIAFLKGGELGEVEDYISPPWLIPASLVSNDGLVLCPNKKLSHYIRGISGDHRIMVISTDIRETYVAKDGILYLNIKELSYRVYPCGILTHNKTKDLRYYTHAHLSVPPNMVRRDEGACRPKNGLYRESGHRFEGVLESTIERTRGSGEMREHSDRRTDDTESLLPDLMGSYVVYTFAEGFIPVKIHTTDALMVIQTTDSYYRYAFGVDGAITCDRISLVFSDDLSINRMLVQRPRIPYKPPSIPVHVNAHDDVLAIMCKLALAASFPDQLEVTLISGADAARGIGAKRDFVEQALNQFVQTYMDTFSTMTCLRTKAFEDITDAQISLYGRMLHMSMTVLDTRLPIKLPISVLEAVLDRDLTVAEFEYVARAETPEAFECLQPFKNDLDYLATCGYDSYIECLQAFVHYDPSQHTRTISTHIAKGILDYTPIANTASMNLPTLNYYFSGRTCIDRLAFKQRITESPSVSSPPDFLSAERPSSSSKCPPLLRNLMHRLIDTVTEEALQNLLKNWSGTSVLLKKQYSVDASPEDTPTIQFRACFLTLRIPMCLVTGEHKLEPIESLYALLTAPIDHIVDPPLQVDSDVTDSNSEEIDSNETDTDGEESSSSDGEESSSSDEESSSSDEESWRALFSAIIRDSCEAMAAMADRPRFE